MNDLIGKKYYVLSDNKGYVKLIDVMPNPSLNENLDLRIVQAARMSFDGVLRGDDKDKKLIDYLMKNHHDSPFEMIQYTFEIYCPLPIAVQWMRHRTASYNQLSRRYTDERIEFYVPEWRGQDENNKQASNVILTFEEIGTVNKHYKELMSKSEMFYNYLIDMGISKEQARFALPQSLYTKFMFSMNLRNLLHFLKLRADKHAQFEIQQYAVCIYDKFVKQLNSWTCESFEKYNDFGRHYVDVKDIQEDEEGFFVNINDEEFFSDNKFDLIKNLEQYFIVTNIIEE